VPKAFALDDVNPRHDPLALGDARAPWPVHTDGVHLVEIGHRVIVLRELADTFERSDVAVHRIDALEQDQLRAAWRCARQQRREMPKIVMAPNVLGAAGGAHALDYRIVVVRIGQDQAVREEPGDGCDAGMVGDVARSENQRRLLAMQIRKLGLQLHHSSIRARYISRPRRPPAPMVRAAAHIASITFGCWPMPR
jgi:hypothetical protein